MGKTKDEVVRIRMTSDLHKKVKTMAKDQDTNLSRLVRKVLRSLTRDYFEAEVPDFDYFNYPFKTLREYYEPKYVYVTLLTPIGSDLPFWTLNELVTDVTEDHRFIHAKRSYLFQDEKDETTDEDDMSMFGHPKKYHSDPSHQVNTYRIDLNRTGLPQIGIPDTFDYEWCLLTEKDLVSSETMDRQDQEMRAETGIRMSKLEFLPGSLPPRSYPELNRNLVPISTMSSKSILLREEKREGGEKDLISVVDRRFKYEMKQHLNNPVWGGDNLSDIFRKWKELNILAAQKDISSMWKLIKNWSVRFYHPGSPLLAFKVQKFILKQLES